LSNLPNPLAKPLVENTAAAASGWDDDDWNFDDLDKQTATKKDGGDIDINSKEYKNKNLNMLSDNELAKEKSKMDK
jgi:hypothetical protein